MSKNFSRYTFGLDGSVTNKNTGKVLNLDSRSTTENHFYTLLNDEGKKVSVKIGVVKYEAKMEAQEAKAQKKEEKPKKEKSATKPEKAKKEHQSASAAGRSHKPSLNYEKAQEIRKKKAAGAKTKDLCSEYEVTSATISCVCKYVNYPLKDGDTAYLPVPAAANV